MQTAHELDPTCPQHKEEVDKLKRYIPVQLADILEVTSESPHVYDLGHCSRLRICYASNAQQGSSTLRFVTHISNTRFKRC